jgi:hypothetical protein
MLPLVFCIKDKQVAERFRIVSEVSAITHAHIRSIVACFIYCEYAQQLLEGQEKYQAFRRMQQTVNPFFKAYAVCPEEELYRFHRLLEDPVGNYQIQPVYQYRSYAGNKGDGILRYMTSPPTPSPGERGEEYVLQITVYQFLMPPLPGRGGWGVRSCTVV